MGSRSTLPVFGLLLVVALGAAGWWAWSTFARPPAAAAPALHSAAQGPLRVTVLESGSLEALKSTTIASQVEGQAAIIYLVEEGTILTAEDVAQGRVIVKLDASELEERISKQNLDVQAARAAKVNAEASFSIQVQEDASKERQATLEVEFAGLDLKRYVGEELAQQLEQARRRVLAGEQRVEEFDRGLKALLADERLKGEALQTQRQLKSDISLAQEELKRAQVKWDWSKKLLEKDFVSRDEEDADRLAVERRRIELDRAETAYTQFATYDFAKALTKLLSGLIEAEGELARVKDRARAAQERAKAEVSAKKEQELLQVGRYEKYLVQLAACVIKAPKAGLVLYASSSGDNRWGGDERIKEGTQVRERQPILTLPDTDQMGARINVHESVVDKVKAGQAVTVTVDAIPDQALEGEVQEVKTQPNATDRWMNPDLKVYATLIRLKGALPGMRPGMSVKAEILVAELPDVLRVPVQAVAGAMGRPTVWVYAEGKASERRVELGWSNDRFVEVTQGLAAGDQVLLAPPRGPPASGAALDASGAPRAQRPARVLPTRQPAGDAGVAPQPPTPGSPGPSRRERPPR